MKQKFEPFTERVYLSSPTMHGEELKYMTEAYQTNWMSTIGANIDSIEADVAKKLGVGYTVAIIRNSGFAFGDETSQDQTRRKGVLYRYDL